VPREARSRCGHAHAFLFFGDLASVPVDKCGAIRYLNAVLSGFVRKFTDLCALRCREAQTVVASLTTTPVQRGGAPDVLLSADQPKQLVFLELCRFA
jgi:hypothetical protein